MINQIKKYITRIKLLLNVEKSKIMVFKKGGRNARNEEWKWDGVGIEKVKKFKGEVTRFCDPPQN